MTAALRQFLAELRDGRTVARPPKEDWSAMILRTSQTDVACVVDAHTYDYFLDVLPPKYQGFGFAFAEGAEPLRYFWHVQPDSHFCRQLTWDETQTFCRLAGIPIPT